MPDSKPNDLQQPQPPTTTTVIKPIVAEVVAVSKDKSKVLLKSGSDYRVGETTKYPSGTVAIPVDDWKKLPLPLEINTQSLFGRPANLVEALYAAGYFVETPPSLVNATDIKMALAKVVPTARAVTSLVTKK